MDRDPEEYIKEVLSQDEDESRDEDDMGLAQKRAAKSQRDLERFTEMRRKKYSQLDGGKKHRKNKRRFLSNATHRSSTDPDARVAKKSGKPRMLCYTSMMGVDTGQNVITHIAAEHSSKKDSRLLQGTVKRAADRLKDMGLKMDTVLADAGFSSGENYRALKEGKLKGYIPVHGSFKAEQVLTYLSRYVHRVAFSESRILEVTEEEVHFDYKDYRLKNTKDRPVHRQMWLEGEEFIRRFLMHTLVPGFQRIRYYGIWASAARKKLRHAQKLLAGPLSIQAVVWSVRHFLQQVLGIDPDVCPGCGCVGQLVSWRLTPGGELLPLGTRAGARAPPPLSNPPPAGVGTTLH